MPEDMEIKSNRKLRHSPIFTGLVLKEVPILVAPKIASFGGVTVLFVWVNKFVTSGRNNELLNQKLVV